MRFSFTVKNSFWLSQKKGGGKQMRISEYKIHCVQCHLLSKEANDRGLTIQVPIIIALQDEPFSATIDCQILKHNHRLTLKGLQDAAGHEIELSQGEQHKLESSLKRVEDSRLCGNAKICPQRIVKLVAKPHGSI
jgi:hypothetical protein